MNWSKLYRPAFEHIADKCGYKLSEENYEYAIGVLTKYNTRVNTRDYEVSSTQIFTEILSGMGLPMKDMEKVKHHFYSFFQARLKFAFDEECLR